MMNIFLASPRGFCAGVNRAINIVERALQIYGTPIYVRNEVVHNRYVVESFRVRGVVFVEEISEVPDRSILIFSAHGVSKAVRNEAMARDFKMIFDATCPLVSKVHKEVERASLLSAEVILIGHAGHPEIEGTIGQYRNLQGGIYLIESKKDVLKLQVKNDKNLCFMTQTTLSVDDTADIINALRHRFPSIMGPRKADICYATANRQKAVRDLANVSDVVFVVGSKNSSNSNRLVELARRSGKSAYLINSAEDIHENWLMHARNIGITAGASAPDVLVQEVVSRLQVLTIEMVCEIRACKENMVFGVPKELLVNTKCLD